MYFTQLRNLLPKDFVAGVALKTQASKHQLSRLGVCRKLLKFHQPSRLTKISMGGLVVLYLLSYQPTFTIPPLKKVVAEAQFSQQQSIDAQKLSQPFNLPHPGYLSTRFSKWHPGIDIATGLGMPIKPVAGGRVSEVTFGFFGLGHNVIIEHEQGYNSSYGHMGRIFVKKGDLVEQSSIIGEVGLTGRTTGPHTHLEMTKNGGYIDPQTILPTLSDWPTAAGAAPKGDGPVKKPLQVKEKTSNTNKQLLVGINYFSQESDTKSAKLPLLPVLPTE